MSQLRLSFPGTAWADVTLPAGANLSEHLTAATAPLLFGCRTGLCATCLVTVEGEGEVEPPDADEAEILDLFAPGDPTARLACQLRASGALALRRHPEAP